MKRTFTMFVGLFLCLTSSHLSAQQLCSRIQNDDHDAEERTNGKVKITSSDLEMAYDKDFQVIGLYFQNPGLTPGATVSQSQITFEVDETSSENTSLRIYAQLSANAMPFSNQKRNITNRSKTVSSVQWNPSAWNKRDEKHQTPDLSMILTELASLPGFNTQSPIVLLIEGTGKRVAESYEGEPQAAPELCFTTGITPPVVNQPPSFTSTPATTAVVGTPYSYTPVVADPDTAVPSISVSTKPSWLNFSAGILTGTPTSAGVYGVTLSATDGTTTVNQVFNISVSDAPVTTNEPPSFTDLAPTSVAVGSLYQHTFTAVDTENNPLTFAATTIPNWLSMSGATLSGTPSIGNVGVHNVTVTVADAFNAPVSKTFSITVTGTPPPDGNTATVCSTISKKSDDAEQRTGKTLSTGSSDLEMIYDKGDQLVGLRFENLNIPAGAQVTSAFVQFQVDETPRGAAELIFRGEIGSNPQTFSASNDIESRNLGNAMATWNPPIWNKRDERGDAQKSVNLSAIINEVVNSSTYSQSDAIVLVIDGSGERVAEAFDGNAAGAPELCVSYSSTPDTQAPTAPTNLVSTNASSNSIGLSWGPATDNVGISKYLIFQDGVQVGSTSNTNFTVAGLNPSSTFSFYVISQDLAGLTSGESNNIFASTTALPVCSLPQVNATAICKNGTTNSFYITVEIIGGSGTFTLTNSENSDSRIVSAGATEELGPFANNSSVDLELSFTESQGCNTQVSNISSTCFVPGPTGGTACKTISGISRIDKLDVGDHLRDNEGLAYVPSDDVFWIADDNQNAAVCVDMQGNLVRKITQSDFKSAKNFHDGKKPSSGRTEDIEAAAYDGDRDILYMFSGKCCPNPPAAYRLMRDNNGDFQVESWVKLSSPNNDFTGAAYHPTEGLFVGTNRDIKKWNYETNKTETEFRIPNGHQVYGMGFSEDGKFLWLAVDKTDVIRIDWKTKKIVNTINTKKKYKIADSRAVEQIGNLLYVSDGNSDLAISVFELDCSSSNASAQKSNKVLAQRVVDENKVEIFPNPTSGVLKVKIGRNNNAGFSYKLISNNGRVLDMGDSPNTQLELNLSEYAKGVYFLQLITENGNFTSHPVLKK